MKIVTMPDSEHVEEKKIKVITMVIYEAKDGWRWRAMTHNNRIVADSAEAYVSKRNAKRAAETLLGAKGYVFFISNQFGKMGNKKETK